MKNKYIRGAAYTAGAIVTPGGIPVGLAYMGKKYMPAGIRHIKRKFKERKEQKECDLGGWGPFESSGLLDKFD